MSSRLVLQFLGLPQVQLDDKPVSTDRRKAIALLAYLAVNDVGKAHQKYSRESLSTLFWPDYDQAKAFSNLRRTIWEVHQAIGEGWLIAERESVHLNEDVEINLDVARFQDLLSKSRKQSDPATRIPLLTDSVQLYRDHFLTGFSLKDAPNFNEWVFAESEDLRRTLAEALTILSEDYCVLGEADQAIPYARRLVTLDPLNESAHRQLMEVYLQAGQHSAALKQYQTCEQILRKELNLDPQPETLALYKKIRKREMKPVQTKEQIETIASQKGAAMPLPTGTVTFLFTDIEGSTKLAQQYPDAMPALLARHHEILNQCIQAHNGYAFQIVGDSFCAAFYAASDALDAASDAQRLLQNEAWTPVPIKVRMGIHTGAAQLQDDSKALRYSGYAAIALTQRIMSAGHGGQILLSQASQDLIRRMLPPDIKVRDMNEHHLKDFAQTERIYQMVVPGLVNDFPPLQTFAAFSNNLPMQLSSFIGREKEQAEIANLITKHRLVTLVGAGGIGKSRLSIQTASTLLTDFPNGVWLVELAPLSDPALVTQAVCTALDVTQRAGTPALNALMDYLHLKKVLLVVDNCEHLIDACAQLAKALLHACPDLCIIASSREALGIEGEIAYRVPSLSLPDKHGSLHAIEESEAVKLFMERANALLPEFEITESNAPVIAKICQRLDGIALAIELAASRVKILKVEQIAARLNDRFRLLTGGARTALPRHQTLQALIDWSYNLLSDEERIVLRRLSVFIGGWTLEAAESVCGNANILDLLTHVVDKSLVAVDREHGDAARYYLLETIRQYVREKLAESGEGEQTRTRHLDYFLKLAERAESALRGPDQVTWLGRLDGDLDNIRTALDWALDSDVEAGLRLATALLWLWQIRGYQSEGCEWLERALAAEARERVNKPSLTAHVMLRAQALYTTGFLMVWWVPKLEQGKLLLEQSLVMFRELGTEGRRGMAYALRNLGWVAYQQEDYSRAKALLEESLALFRAMDDKFGIAECLLILGDVVALVEGDFPRAKAICEEHLALSKALGDKDGIASSLGNLGRIASWQGDYRQATAMLEESIAVAHEVGNRDTVNLSQSELAHIERRLGHFAEALAMYKETIVRWQEIGQRAAVAHQMECFAFIARAQSQEQRAIRLLGAAQALRKRINSPMTSNERVEHDHEVSVLRAQMDGSTFAAAWEEGRKMTLDEAVAYALDK
jgi:predicted ATPase/DNA-binding SARP family transcriptional activator